MRPIPDARRAGAMDKHQIQAVSSSLGGSMGSAVDIFNTLCVFTKEPIREQEIKLECMNFIQNCLLYTDNGTTHKYVNIGLSRSLPGFII